MYKPRLDELHDYMTARWIANGFKQLPEPVDTQAYISIIINASFYEDCQNFTDFYERYLESALRTLGAGVRASHNGEFYYAGAYYRDDMLVLISSHGDMPEHAKSKEDRTSYIPDAAALQTIKEDIEARWLSNGFVKLDEPVKYADGVYCAFQVGDEYCPDAETFRFIYLEPAILAIERVIPKSENSEFYCIAVRCNADNVFSITSSRGAL
jgi:hypothetical protein